MTVKRRVKPREAAPPTDVGSSGETSNEVGGSVGSSESAPPKPRGRKKKRRSPCGFCSEVNKKARHDLCPVIIRNADQSVADKVWRCPCALEFPELHHRAKDGSK